MTDYFETKSQPIRDELVHPTKILHYLCVINKHERPCEDEVFRKRSQTFLQLNCDKLGTAGIYFWRFCRNEGLRFPYVTRLWSIFEETIIKIKSIRIVDKYLKIN